jgi:hypothetical protein
MSRRGRHHGEELEQGTTSRREPSCRDRVASGALTPAGTLSSVAPTVDAAKPVLSPDRAGGPVPRRGTLGPRPHRLGSPHLRRPRASAIEPHNHALTLSTVSATTRPFSPSCAQQARWPSQRLSSVSEASLRAVWHPLHVTNPPHGLSPSCRHSSTLLTTCSMVCASQVAATRHLLDVLHERR